MGFRVRVVLATGVAAVCGAAMTGVAGVASAASKPKTSVSLQIPSQVNFQGHLRSSKASCVRSRTVRLQERKGRKWVAVATVKSNRSGRFHGRLRAAAGGRYRAFAAAKASCKSGTSKTVAAPAGNGGSGTPGGPGSGTPGGTTGPQQPSCSMPLTHDTYDGFHVAVPSGWELLTLNGELEVEKDAVGSEAVIVAPSAQTSGLTAASYFQSQLSTFESQATSGGGSVTVSGSSSSNGIPSDTFTGQIAGQAVNGRATVLVEPLTGQAGSTELVFVADWAPSSSFGSESSLLSSVANCYGPEKGTLYRIFQDQAFTYMLPPGWSIPNVSGAEGPDNINLVDGTGDVVAYQHTISQQQLTFNSPQTLIDGFLAYAGVTGVTKLSSVTPSSSGTEYEEFTAIFQGKPVHGLVYGEVTNSNGVYLGVVRIGIAQAANWNAVNGALIQMAGFIQHQFTQDLETINQINRQWQSFSNQVSNFDDILNNQQLTQDPTTGIFYDAPYDSYDSEGTNGPGYYYGDQKLNIINRQ